VLDAYRWLENSITDERKAFIDAQNNLTHSYLNANKYRAEIKKGLTDLTNFEKYGLPSKQGNKYYYTHNSGLQNQGIIYQTDSLEHLNNSKIFLDPNKLSDEGTTFLSFTSFSPDAKWVVYGANEGGGDWMQFRIRNVETGRELNETLIKIKFIQPSWSKDSLGFSYSVS
jgi:prolyl oligopeptidase